MATKNNFSKAVLDLMGLPGNENAAPGRVLDDVAETVFDQNKRVDVNIGRDTEPEKDAEFDIDRRKFLYNAKTVTASNVVPIQEDTPATVISRSMVIVGEITSSGSIDIYGDVKGSVKTDGRHQSNRKNRWRYGRRQLYTERLYDTGKYYGEGKRNDRCEHGDRRRHYCRQHQAERQGEGQPHDRQDVRIP